MKRFFEYLGIAGIILFSFYYTEKAALLVQSKSPIMEQVKESAATENVDYVNAIIDGDTIIPGINGLEVNTDKSFLKMKDFGAFNEYYLVYNEVKPEISLENNKDKIIVRGNSEKKAVALIIDKNENVENYLISKNIIVNKIVYESSYKDNSLENINGESDKSKFNNVESLLNKSKYNANICILNDLNKDICLKNKKYLIKPSSNLTSANLIEVKQNITNGAIIIISETAQINDVNLLLKQIEYKGLTIMKLSELIKETKN